jgi:hypothetical protein
MPKPNDHPPPPDDHADERLRAMLEGRFPEEMLPAQLPKEESSPSEKTRKKPKSPQPKKPNLPKNQPCD